MESRTTHWLKVIGGLMVLVACLALCVAFIVAGLSIGFEVDTDIGRKALAVVFALAVPILVMLFFCHVSEVADKDEQRGAGK